MNAFGDSNSIDFNFIIKHYTQEPMCHNCLSGIEAPYLSTSVCLLTYEYGSRCMGLSEKKTGRGKKLFLSSKIMSFTQLYAYM